MDAPPIQYARSDDGVSLAYWSLGARTNPPLIIVASDIGHLTAKWEIERYQKWYVRLAQRFFLIAYDARGFGLSQRHDTDLALARYAADIAAVSAELALDRPSLLASGYAAPPAIVHAVERPEAVSHLVLNNPTARSSDADTTPWGQGIGRTATIDWTSFLRASGALFTGYADAELAEEVARMLDEGATSEQYAAYRRATAAWDVTQELANVEAKTLVIARKESPPWAPFAAAQAVASQIPNARLIVSRDTAAVIELGDADANATEIERFILGAPADALPDAPRTPQADVPPDQVGPDPDSEELPPENPDRLTARELQVLGQVALGRRNKEIAEDLVITSPTVTRHISNLLAKTGCSNRTELGRYATDRGLAGPS